MTGIPAATFAGYAYDQEAPPDEAQYAAAVAHWQWLIDQHRIERVAAFPIMAQIIYRWLSVTGMRCEQGKRCPDYREGFAHAHTAPGTAWKNVIRQ
jgi:hypothetical protein